MFHPFVPDHPIKHGEPLTQSQEGVHQSITVTYDLAASLLHCLAAPPHFVRSPTRLAAFRWSFPLALFLPSLLCPSTTLVLLRVKVRLDRGKRGINLFLCHSRASRSEHRVPQGGLVTGSKNLHTCQQ